MRKFLLLITAILFISVGAFASERQDDEKDCNIKQQSQTVDFKGQKSAKNDFKILNKKTERNSFFKTFKEVRKIKKELKKNQTAMDKMMLTGLALLLGGLIIHLIGVPLVGTILMVIGVVILLYAILKKYF